MILLLGIASPSGALTATPTRTPTATPTITPTSAVALNSLETTGVVNHDGRLDQTKSGACLKVRIFVVTPLPTVTAEGDVYVVDDGAGIHKFCHVENGIPYCVDAFNGGGG